MCALFKKYRQKNVSRSKMKVLYRETLLLFQLWSPLGFWFPFAKFSMQKHRGGKQESLYASASHPCAMPVSSFALLKWCLMMITLLENVKRSKDNQKEIQDEKDVFKRIKKESKDHSKTFLKPSISSYSKTSTMACVRLLNCFDLQHNVIKTKH